MDKKKKPFHLLKGMTRLTLSELESRLLNANKSTNLIAENGWTPVVISQGLIFDLSAVHWVDMGAALQLCLLVESAKKKGVHIMIALPLQKLTRNQEKHIVQYLGKPESKEDMFIHFRNLRENARNYLKLIQFERAIICSHISTGKVQLKDDFDSSDALSLETSISEQQGELTEQILTQVKPPEEIGYRFIVPLTWYSPIAGNEQFPQLEDIIQIVLAGKERGLDKIDALAIQNVIISELSKNIIEHAHTDHAIIGIVLQPGYTLLEKHFPAPEKPYIRWSSQVNKTYISIYYGDTGVGLINSLKIAYQLHHNTQSTPKGEIIKWAFDKWSTSKLHEQIRGTKGLYRIQRIINKYNGLITIRTTDVLGGFQKGGMHTPSWISSKSANSKPALCYFPGTMLRMHFSPFRELTKFEISPDINAANPGKQKWVTLKLNLDHIDPKFIFKETYSLNRLFHKNSPSILFVVSIDREALPTETKITEAIKNCLLYLSEGRHPNGVALYGFPGGWEAIDAIVDSVNFLIWEKKELLDVDQESRSPDHEQVFDPVLILGEKREYAWVGGDPKIVEFLKELYRETEKHQNKISELQSYKELSDDEKARVIQYFNLDPAYIELAGNNSVRFNFRDLQSYYSNRIYQKVNEQKENKNIHDIYYVTPNLRKVLYWIDIEQIIREDIKGFALAMSVLLKDQLKQLPESLESFKILVDNHDMKEFAIQFGIWLGIPATSVVILNDEIDGKLPRRNPIFERSDNVIIVTTITSTTETARRAIKAIKRDSANAVVVLGLINQESDDRIWVWGDEIPLLSLATNINFEITDEYIEQEKLRPVYKQPISYALEVINEEQDKDQQEKQESLYDLITSQQALHFSHFGQPNIRHFTFLLSPGLLIKNKEQAETVIFNQFFDAIKEWLNKSNAVNFEIWRPQSDHKGTNPSQVIAEKIKSFFNTDPARIVCSSVSEIKFASSFGEWTITHTNNHLPISSENTVIVDWGSITGNTTQQLIQQAANEGKSNILVCILFSQLPLKEENFISSICNIKGRKIKIGTDLLSRPTYDEIDCSVTIKYFYRLPLRNYETLNCPVCEHIHSLLEHEIKGEYMTDFSSSRRKRLQIREREKAEDLPQDFYADKGVYFDSVVIMEMFRFRTLLQESFSSTFKREKVEMYLREIVDNILTERQNKKSKLYAVLYLLSVEIMWLQKPPLLFQSIRVLIADMALKVSIWPRSEMHKVFPVNAEAVRYKFAATSVLRSADKIKFLKNVGQIYTSNKFRSGYSRSLTQNLFFHIYTYLKRPYHTSAESFDTIIENLRIIEKDNRSNSNILYVVHYLKNLSQKRKFNYELVGKSKMELIKSLKTEINNCFGINLHSIIYDTFRDIGPLYVEELVKALDNSQIDNTLILNRIREWTSTLLPKWGEVSSYIDTVILNHLYHLRDLYNSDTFERFYIEENFPLEKAEDITYGYNDPFTIVLHDLVSNPEKIKINFDRYSRMYRQIYNNIFSTKKYNDPVDAKIMQLAGKFPADSVSLIREALAEFKSANYSEIPEVTLSFVSEQVNIFFPDSAFKFGIRQILNNTLKHKDDRFSVAESRINITLTRSAGRVKIEISNTNSVDRRNNPDGALSQLENEIARYDGTLTRIPGNQFTIILELLEYE